MPGLIIADAPEVSPLKLRAPSVDWKTPQVTSDAIEIGSSSDDESVPEVSADIVVPTQQPTVVAYDGKTPTGPRSPYEICEQIFRGVERYRLLSAGQVHGSG